jgi:hypothetical protein
MRVQVDTPLQSITGRLIDLVGSSCDVEGVFKLADDDDGAVLLVYGWRCQVTIIPACAAIGEMVPSTPAR